MWTRITVIRTPAFLAATTHANHSRCVLDLARFSIVLVLLYRWLSSCDFCVQQASPPFKLNPSTNPDRPGQRTNYIMLVDRGPRKSPISRFLWMCLGVCLPCTLLMRDRCCSRGRHGSLQIRGEGLECPGGRSPGGEFSLQALAWTYPACSRCVKCAVSISSFGIVEQ